MTALSVPDFPRSADYCGAWAIEPTRGAALASRVKMMDLQQHIAEARSPGISSDFQRKQVGNKFIAMIPIAGLLMKSASSLGGTSTVEARRQIRAAVADNSISSIALMIDSPGGSVSGTSDLADEVKAANASKPVYAFIEDLGASAAYWIASQASRIVANSDTAQVGSIGTLLVLYDQSEQAKKEGVRTIVIGTGPIKGAGTPGAAITPEQETYFREMVEAMQVSFDAAVRTGRKLSLQQLATVKTGGVFSAREALRLGLVDAIQSFDAFSVELANQGRQTIKAGRPAKGFSAMEFSSWCFSIGLDPANVPAQNLAQLQASHAALYPQGEPAASTDDLSHILRSATALLPRAMAESWTPARASKEAQTFMRAQLANNVQPNTGLSFASGNHATSADHLAAAFLVKAGHANTAEAAYGPVVMEQSKRLHRASFVDLCEASLRMAGRDIPDSRNEMIRAASSYTSLTTALGSSADKIMEQTWKTNPATWRSFAAIRSAPNLRQQTSLRPTFGGAMEELAPDGKIKHGTIVESTFTWQAKTYAKMFAISRTNIINDDLSVFSELIPGLGKMAVRTLNDLVYTVWLANSGSFFASGNSNLSTSSALTTSTLATAVKKLRIQKAPNGPLSTDTTDLDIQPQVLLVPPSLEITARGLLNSAEIARSTASDLMLPTGNPHQGLAKLEIESRLENSAFSGYSTTTWYLTGGPEDMPIVVGFLDGKESPTVEAFGLDHDASELSMQFRVYQDFGAAYGDYRAAQRSDA